MYTGSNTKRPTYDSPSGHELNAAFANLSVQQQPQTQKPSSHNIALIGTVPNMCSNSLKEEIDETASINPACHPLFMSSTMQKIPSSSSLFSKCKVPLAVVITPHPAQIHPSSIPLCSGSSILRCKKCRSYINPYVEFIDGGSKYICNFCFLPNEIPPEYDYDSRSRTVIDRKTAHPELTSPVVEWEATGDYMIRPPQPPIFLFLVDASHNAIASGTFAVALEALVESLERSMAFPRTKVAFITFDEAVHFYAFSHGQVQEFVVSDLDGEPYVPCPEESLLVSLSEDIREQAVSLLKSISAASSAGNAAKSACNVFGVALKYAQKLLGSQGGKIVGILSAAPNAREGAISRNRVEDDPSALGTARESPLLQPSTLFYKDAAIKCCGQQICVDLFLLTGANAFNADIATLGNICTYTGGHLFHFPAFKAASCEDVHRFSLEFFTYLSTPFGLEAVLRVRASRGIQIEGYYGSFFMRSADLLSLPNANFSHSFVVQASVEDTIEHSFASFQSALLFTTVNGERRIRVCTLALPVTQDLHDLLSHVSQSTLANVLGKMAVERVISNKLEDARDWLLTKTCDIVGGLKALLCPTSPNPQLLMSENLGLFPLFILGLLKSKALRPGTSIGLDERSNALLALRTASVTKSRAMFLPKFFLLSHFDSPAVGYADASGAIAMPVALNLTSEKLASFHDGIFLLDNGGADEMMLWIGAQADPVLLRALFKVEGFGQLCNGRIMLNSADCADVHAARIHAIISTLKWQNGQSHNPYVNVVKEDAEARMKFAFLSHLIEDRTDNFFSYPQFLLQIRDKVIPQ